MSKRSLGNSTAKSHIERLLILYFQRYIPQYVDGELRAEPGFTLPLSRGSPIISVAQAGSSSCNTCSHLLARTISEVRESLLLLKSCKRFLL